MTIDFRIKAPIPHWENLFNEGKQLLLQTLHLQGVEPTPSETLADVIAEQDALGITHAVIMGRGNETGSSNEELQAFLSTQPTKRFIGFIGTDNLTIEEAVETIKSYGATGAFHGVSINPLTIRPKLPIGDPALDPIFEASRALDLPVSITLSGLMGLISTPLDYDYARPGGLYRVAQKYPDLKLIISHAAWPFASEAISIAIYNPNIYLSPDLYLAFPGSKLYVEAANFALADRLLYGSCYPNVPYSFAIEHFHNQEWKTGVLDKVLYKNATKLLKLT